MPDTQPAVRLEVQEDVALILISNPPVNAASHAVRQGLLDCLNAANADAAVKAIVIACEGRTFIAGADIREFGKPSIEPALPTVLDAIEASPKPVVAAIHGTALGGGLETALACHARVASADAAVGLPEVKLGIIPGAAGTQRLPRLAGVPFALDMCTSGRMAKAGEALANGVIDSIADGDLRTAAIALARKLAGTAPRRTRDLKVADYDKAKFDAVVADVKRRARGAQSPLAAAAAVAKAAGNDYAAGVEFERETFKKLVVSDQSKAMRYVFFSEREVQKVPVLAGVTPRRIETAGVIGAGTMGAGIALSLIDCGVPVTLVETSEKALEAGRTRMLAVWDRAVQLGRISEDTAAKRRAMLKTSLSFDDLGTCDLIIEAVFEEMSIKHDLFARVGKIAKPDAVLASNTSYLNVDEIADASGRPADFIGMHFFSPANIMRLVEVVACAGSAKDAVAAGVEITRRMGKLPVVCGVCDGFVGNRILAAWRPVADFALEEGATPEAIDTAMEKYGMAMGPYAVSDLAGLDIGMRRRKEFAHLRDPEKRYPSGVADQLCALGRYGQKTGAGYYKYVGGKRTVDPEVTKIIENVSAQNGITRKPADTEKVVAQIHAVMVNEGAKILAEGIVARGLDIDMVLLSGYGYPVWRGGPMFQADLIGLDKVLATVLEVQQSAGKGFEPAPLLVKLAREGRTFGDLKPGEAAAG